MKRLITKWYKQQLCGMWGHRYEKYYTAEDKGIKVCKRCWHKKNFKED